MFWFYSSPDPAIVKNLFLDFRIFHYTSFFWIYIIFHILTQTKNPRKKHYKFQRHSLFTALNQKKSVHAHNVFFYFGFWASPERRVDEIKNSKSKIILWLPHPSFARYHRIFNFWATLLIILIVICRCSINRNWCYWLLYSLIRKELFFCGFPKVLYFWKLDFAY